MKELFDQADLNGDGALTDRECNGFCDAIRMFHGLRSPLSEEFYAIVLDELDPEETGRIYLDDLKELYQAVWDERRTGVLNPDAPMPTIGDEEEAAGRRALEALTAELPPPTPITHRHGVEGSSRKSSGEMGNEEEREDGEGELGVEKEKETVVEADEEMVAEEEEKEMVAEEENGTVVEEGEKEMVVEEEKEAVMVVNNGDELGYEGMRGGQAMGEEEGGERKLEAEEEGMTVVAREEEVTVEEQGEMRKVGSRRRSLFHKQMLDQHLPRRRLVPLMGMKSYKMIHARASTPTLVHESTIIVVRQEHANRRVSTL
ncbi:conserved hypothetical protein [Perkinsus marinus ATCC 50983]|uniref:Calmodulin n=1 Tax=Perkinsus marinus (strain ATCC 50983 / TXsc) TaxID=423536 RepID=C5LWH5_PERM5|nr:conserved hypothetical protein [Perkinsus marinus ATCC 50983]EEQ98888.1 conserved hypothetical protein [Perkinsus marinus ATCC 50983]|eukprot:XP_002766171.1 conserved hypothetical protein [Perkinsus marinus ATCC 50983]